jgi:hypothetical protein
LPQTTDVTVLKSQFIEYFEDILADGEIIGEMKTDHGIIDFLADIELLEGKTILHVKDVTIYPRSKSELKGLVIHEMLKLKTELIDAAYQLGFKGLRITGQRAEHSTSANPGYVIDRLIDLKMRFKRRKMNDVERETKSK